MIRSLSVAGCLLLAIVLFGVGFRMGDAKGIAEAQAHSDSLDTALEALRAAQTERAQQDTTLARTAVLTRLRVDTIRVQVSVAESIFVQQLPESLSASFRQIVAMRDSLMAGQDRVIGAQAQQLGLRAATIEELQVALAEAIKDRDRWRSVAKVPLYRRILQGLPLIAGGFLLGKIL